MIEFVNIITCILVFAIFRLLSDRILSDKLFKVFVLIPSFLYCVIAPFLPDFVFRLQLFLISNAVFISWLIHFCGDLVKKGKSQMYFFLPPISVIPFVALFIILNSDEIEASNIFVAIGIFIIYLAIYGFISYKMNEPALILTRKDKKVNLIKKRKVKNERNRSKSK